MNSNKIAVLGANGQLGKCIQKLVPEYEWDYEFIFADSATVDITDKDSVLNFFSEHQPDYCINAAAYTAVDLAEKEEEKAFAVNAEGVANIAEACKEHKCIFLHISTDYVFDGDTEISYDEENFTNPQSIYGKSKLQGEVLALENNPDTIIIRTSWLYSEFNKNFVKTMLHLFKDREELNVVSDQYGQPTNANDLAKCLLQIIQNSNKKFGIYHFSNYPETNWSSFAKKIAEFAPSKIKINEITTAEYPTPAKRPMRSTMDLSKIEKDYNIDIQHWETSLKDCVEILNNI